MLIVLLIIFVIVMVLWLLALTGSISANTSVMGFIACLILGAVVFLVGSGLATMPR